MARKVAEPTKEPPEAEVKVFDQDPRELTEEKRLAEGRVKGQADGAPAKDATLHAHWARDNPNRIRELQAQGYRMAKLEDLDELATRGYKEGGVIRFKDTVLMVCPRAAVEQRELARQGLEIERDRRKTEEIDQEGGLETGEDHHQRSRGRKYYMP